MISGIYVSFMVIYHLFVDSCLYGMNGQFFLLPLRKDKKILPWKEFQGNITNKYVNIFGK